MTEITYLDKSGEEQVFSVELPEKLECRLDYFSFAIIWAALEESFYSDDPKDMYHYTEIVCEDFPILCFMLVAKYELIELTDELRTVYDEIVTCYSPLVVETETGYGYTVKDHVITPPVVAPDYVPPTVVVEPRPEDAPVIPAVTPPPEPETT